MMKLIDKNLLLAYLDAITPENPVSSFGENVIFVIEKIKEYVNAMPTFEPEVRHGRWEYRHADDWMFCTACGADAEGNYDEPLETDYCPHCGARTDGGADNS